ncbi:MAG TPA: hypothetical protein DDY04_06830 [Bacteroidales bacterium]|nr:hypothetical protein [Bacteroidales bacterium]
MIHSNRVGFLLLVGFILFFENSQGQDPVFSQVFFNPTMLNPSYAGASREMRLGIIYRNQWTMIDMPYSTFGVSFDRRIDFGPSWKRSFRHNRSKSSGGSGFGINILSDVEGKGVFTRNAIDLIYSYGIQPTYNSHVRFGLQTSAIFRTRSFSGLIFPDMIDPTGSITGSSDAVGYTSWNYDIGLGVAGDLENFYGGFAVHHLLQPVEANFSGGQAYIPRKYTFHIGADFNLYRWRRFKEVLIFSPNLIYIQQLNFNQLNAGFYLSKNWLVAGFWIRENLSLNSHSFIVTLGYADYKFRIGYSYDFSIMQYGFRGLPTSSHEVTFGWNFEYKRGKKKYRYIKCPKF